MGDHGDEGDGFLRPGRQLIDGPHVVFLVPALGGPQQLLLQQQRVDPGIVHQGLDATNIGLAAAQGAKAGIQRIADNRADTEQLPQALAGLGCERHKRQTVGRGLVQQHAAQAAGESHGAQAVTLGQAGVQQVLRHLHHVIEGGDANGAHVTGNGIEGGDRTRQPARMGQGGRPAVVGRPELDHDHRLSGVLRRGTGGQKPLRLAHRLQIGDDDPGLRIGREILDIVGGLESGLVAAGDDVTHVHAALFEGALERHHQPAGLSDDGDGAGFGGLRPVVGHGDELGAAVEVAETVGAGNGDSHFRDGGGELPAALDGNRIRHLAEAGRNHRGATRPRGRSFAQYRLHERRRHEHRQMVGRLGQFGEGPVAPSAPDLLTPRVQRIDRAAIAVAVEIAPAALRPVPRPVGGADDDHVARVEQGLHVGAWIRCRR